MLLIDFTMRKSLPIPLSMRAKHCLSAKRMSAALHALVVVLVHSLKLQSARPALRTAFWRQLFASKVMRRPMFQSMRFFEWVVEQHACFPPRVVLTFENLPEKQMRAVTEFFTRQRDEPQGWRDAMSSLANLGGRLRAPSPEEQRAFSKCEVGLSFEASELSASCLFWIQRLLDQVAAKEPSTRLCTVQLLTLGTKRRRSMNPVVVEIVAELLSKDTVYQLHEISLQGIVQRPAHNDYQASLWRIAIAMFRIDDGYQRRDTQRVENRKPRRRASLAGISLSVKLVAVIYSSLRYGCTYDEISLADAIKLVDSSEERVECWRWIAFGLFYPRSKSFATSFRLRTIDLVVPIWMTWG